MLNKILKLNNQSFKNILNRWFNFKVFITVVLLAYAYYIIHMFDTIDTGSSTNDIVEQNKIKFKHTILFGKQTGIFVIIFVIWSMFIWFKIFNALVKPELQD